jgi:amino acid adenylation domain-containing protein
MAELLHSGFLRSAEKAPQQPALIVDGRSISYGELRRLAGRLAATLERRTVGGTPLTAVFADRSVTAFAGILGALIAGRGYVPLNPTFPIDRTCQMFERAGCRALIADAAGEQHLGRLLDDAAPTLVLLPARQDVRPFAERWPRHTFAGEPDLDELAPGDAPPAAAARAASADDIAYLLFTSGSTGAPKGVTVTHRNATHFVASVVERYGICAEDRFSQTFDTTFDLSVFDMFVAWQQGACVCCPSRAALWNPGRFIQEQRLTVWFSVPSLAMLMNRIGALKPGSYPSLRWSLFCGERLAADTAAAWAAAAPHSIVENLYGPTELTVACTVYRWDPERSPAESTSGVVPIGEPFPGMQLLVADAALREVAPGEEGELLMAGPQQTPGYWHDEPATAAAYVAVPGRAGRFYRTGDRVRRPVGDGPLTFLGRVDHQIKVRGHRVELGEVESMLLRVPGVESAAAVGWPVTQTGVLGIAAFVTGAGIEPAGVRRALQATLQDYAVPQTIQVLPDLPLNANGKVDRRALMTLLDAGVAPRAAASEA